MSFANILVSLDSGTTTVDRIRVAADLARRFGASLTGVAARKLPNPGPGEDLHTIKSAYDEERAKLSEELSRCRDIFEQNLGEDTRTNWRQGEADPASFLVMHARAADAVIVGRELPDDNAGDMAVAPGPVLMEVGRPVLVVPPGLDRPKAARIIIAWKDTPEARRAVSFALPFIRRADQVFVVSAGSEARFEGAEEVSEFLTRHGAHVTTQLLEVPGKEVTAEILRYANRQDADLVVMGGYGHSRLREWLFGGVTRDILQISPICCLMSHLGA